MIIFNSDLDNTLIYSYKHDIGEDKKNVEIYENREISFMTKKSYTLLKEIHKRMIFVPTTTRTVEQYNRINLGLNKIKYALVCNGGVLLIDGKSDEEWYTQTRKLIIGCDEVVDRGISILENDKDVNFEIRYIEKLFVFTKSANPLRTAQRLKEKLDVKKVDIFVNGAKVYIVPKQLNKGMAVKRLRKKLLPDAVIAAGDSEFDISMLSEADYAFAPEWLEAGSKKTILYCSGKKIFSDELLDRLVNNIGSINFI